MLSDNLSDQSENVYEYKPEIPASQAQDDIIQKYRLPLSLNVGISNLQNRQAVSQTEIRREDGKQGPLYDATWLKRYRLCGLPLII